MTEKRNHSAAGAVLCALETYLCWGFFPLYWKSLSHVPALQILCHRLFGSAVFLLLMLIITRHWIWLETVIQDKRLLVFFRLLIGHSVQ